MLVKNLCGINFNRRFLSAKGNGHKLITPLPKKWQIEISKNIEVSKFWCSVLWKVFLLKQIYKGLIVYIKYLYHGLKGILLLNNKKFSQLIFFDNIPNIDSLNNQNIFNNDNIFSWYVRYKDILNQEIKYNILCSGAFDKKIDKKNISISKAPIFPLPPNKIPNFILFLISGIYLILKALLDLMLGREIIPLFTDDLIKVCAIKYCNNNLQPNECYFNNSEPHYRPLWTYHLEEPNKKVFFFFYSTNNNSFKGLNGYKMQPNQWHILNWPNYLVADNFQSDFVLREIDSSATVRIVGIITISSGKKFNPKDKNIRIAVFDVQPSLEGVYTAICPYELYYTSRNIIKFHEDILFVTNNLKIPVILKNKRSVSKNLIPKNYLRLINKIDQENYQVIDVDYSAKSIMQNSNLTISIPFTSTNIIAKSHNLPSIYYDPVGVIQKDDRAAHGIKVVSGREELYKFIANIQKQWLIK